MEPGMDGPSDERPGRAPSSNPYARLAVRDVPEEIAAFELGMYPYANVVPSPGRPVPPDVPAVDSVTGASVLVRVVSILLLAGIVLAAGLGILSHLLH